jgi:hypothetical protein
MPFSCRKPFIFPLFHHEYISCNSLKDHSKTIWKSPKLKNLKIIEEITLCRSHGAETREQENENVSLVYIGDWEVLMA